MKKFFCILTVFLILFLASCGKKNETSSTSNTSSQITSASIKSSAVFSSAENNTEQKNTLKEQEAISISTTKNPVSSSAYYEQNSGPMIISVTLDNLIKIKKILNTVSPDDFTEYMEKNELTLAMNGMRDYENTLDIMNELESTYFPLLDGDKNNFSESSFYWERNEVQTITFFDEESRIVSYIYTPKSYRAEYGRFGDNEKAVFVEKIENDLLSANIYKTEEEDCYCIDLVVDDTYIFMRTHEIQTIEELEADFARLKFVKIGDLLNDITE